MSFLEVELLVEVAGHGPHGVPKGGFFLGGSGYPLIGIGEGRIRIRISIRWRRGESRAPGVQGFHQKDYEGHTSMLGIVHGIVENGPIDQCP